MCGDAKDAAMDVELNYSLLAGTDLTDNERATIRAEREEQAEALESTSTGSSFSDDQVAALISPEARDFVIRCEIGSRQDYDRKDCRPTWPGGSSGVTIGIGYDIGVQSAAYLHKTWDGLISVSQLNRLATTVGVAGLSARPLCSSLQDIVVPWDVAMEAYQRSTMPTFGRYVLDIFPHAEELHPDAFGALFSLVFNRGKSLSGPRRQQMRDIRDHMTGRAFGTVPQDIRNMKSLWVGRGLDGLVR